MLDWVTWAAKATTDKSKAGRLKSYRRMALANKDIETADKIRLELLEVEEPEVTNPRGRRLCTIFSRLSLRRSSGMGGPEPLQPTEMKAWLELNEVTLRPWEIAMLERMDTTLLTVINSASTKEQTDGLSQSSIPG